MNNAYIEDVYKETKYAIMKYIILKCNNIEDVNDIMQNTYLAFIKRAKKFGSDHVNEPQSYLLKIARDELSKYYKTKDIQSRILNIDDIDDNTLINDHDIDLEISEGKICCEKIWEELKQCDLTAKIFTLYFIYDMKICEIASELNIGESNIKNKLYRTIKKLKSKISED